jgi:D-alanine-D-alanine ligase
MIVLFGGSSYEHEISIVSAITIKEKLDDLVFIFLDRDREFYLIEKENMKSRYFSSFEYKNSKKVEITKNGFRYKKLFGYEIISGVVLNLIHGRDGEDGKIASLMQFFDIKAITPLIEASVISYNKLYTKMYAKELGVDVLDYRYVEDRDYIPDRFPVIIKPLRLGSSIGVSIAKNIDEYRYGIDVAFEFDNGVIVEEFIDGVEEYNLAGCYANGWIFSKIERVTKGEFLSYEDKYLDFSRDKISTSKIDDALATKLHQNFKKIYNSTFRGALIRCDFFVIDKKVYLNEINPIPGSMANYLFDNFSEVIKQLADSVKYEKRVSIDYSYINKIQMAKGK